MPNRISVYKYRSDNLWRIEGLTWEQVKLLLSSTPLKGLSHLPGPDGTCEICGCNYGYYPSECPGIWVKPGIRQSIIDKGIDFKGGLWVQSYDTPWPDICAICGRTAQSVYFSTGGCCGDKECAVKIERLERQKFSE